MKIRPADHVGRIKGEAVDEAVGELLTRHNIPFKTCKDQVIFEKDEVVKDDGKPYTVFTPYSRKWKEKLDAFYLRSYATEKYLADFYKQPLREIPSMKAMGFLRLRFNG